MHATIFLLLLLLPEIRSSCLKVSSIDIYQVIRVVHNRQDSPLIEGGTGMRYPAADLISDAQMLDARASQIGMLIVAIDHACTV